MLVYATTDDLETYTSKPAPDNAESLLRSASRLIRGATRAAIYQAGSNGLPVDDDLLEAFRDAACAQADVWAANDVDPNAHGLDAKTPIRSSLGTGSVEFDTTITGSAAGQALRVDVATTLCEDAAGILTDAGLLSGQPVLFS